MLRFVSLSFYAFVSFLGSVHTRDVARRDSSWVADDGKFSNSRKLHDSTLLPDSTTIIMYAITPTVVPR